MDDRIIHHLKGCDEIWHAGDIGDPSVMKPLEEIAVVRAVYGNIDNQEVRATYPLDNLFEIDEASVFMTHIAGRPGRYPTRVRDIISRNHPDIFVCGHSHILLINRNPESGMVHLNPGAAGHHGFHKKRTMIRFGIDRGRIKNLEAIELGPRGR